MLSHALLSRPCAAVRELKERIASELSSAERTFSVSAMKLMFNDKPLRDDQVLQQAGIQENAELKLAIWQKEDIYKPPPLPPLPSLTLEHAGQLLAAEAAREGQMDETVAAAHAYLTNLTKRAVKLRRFACSRADVGSGDRVSVLVKESLSALEGQMGARQLQDLASKSVEWQMRAQVKEAELGQAKTDLVHANEQAAEYKTRLHRSEAAMQAKAKAAAAAARSPKAPAQTKGQPAAVSAAGLQQSALSVIDDIRREKFVDCEVPASMAAAVESIRNMCGRALEKLSKDIYNYRGHFFSELLQNCDDNEYPAGVTPMLFLQVTEEAVTLLNNECGFTEKDVRSICDIGASTKIDSSAIGRKGIGFKSVFMVSDGESLLHLLCTPPRLACISSLKAH